MTFCINSTELQILYIREDANVQVQERKIAKLCCVIASKGQSGKKMGRERWAGPDDREFYNPV